MTGDVLNLGVVRAVLADAPHSAPVTHWVLRILLTLAVLAALTGVYWLMWRGWKNRAARQADLPVPSSAAPSDAGFGEPSEGVYASTTVSGDWLDRIAAHGLGVRSNARISVGKAGVLVAREAAPDLFIPVGDLVGAQLAPGIAGKVTGGDGVVLVTWRLGGATLDSGFHPRAKGDRARLVDEVDTVIRERTATV
jgi:hypothetical protein